MVLAGVSDPIQVPWEPFDPRAMEYLATVSRVIREKHGLPEEVKAFGFWCRKNNLESMRLRHQCSQRRLGRGLIIHFAPANVPTMFAYSFAIGLLAGNAAVIRLSQRTSNSGIELCNLLGKVLNQAEFQSIRERTSFIQCDHAADRLIEMMGHCDGRVIWGGDRAINELRQISIPPWAVELCFPDRWSLALISQRYASELDDEELELNAHRFCNDTYSMDQAACSSPQLVVWIEDGGDKTVRSRWWKAVAKCAQTYELTGHRAIQKLERVCRETLSRENVEFRIERFGGNLVYVASMDQIVASTKPWKGGYGLFYQAAIKETEDLLPLLSVRSQTITCMGVSCEDVRSHLVRKCAGGVYRIVPFGAALEMDTFWDGQDLIGALSRFMM